MLERHGRTEREAMDWHSSFHARSRVDCFHTRSLLRRRDRRYGRRIRSPGCPIYSGVLAQATDVPTGLSGPGTNRCALGFIVHRKSRPQRSRSLDVTGNRKFCRRLPALFAVFEGHGCLMAAIPQKTNEVNRSASRQRTGKPNQPLRLLRRIRHL
jgi:hypothetical protein